MAQQTAYGHTTSSTTVANESGAQSETVALSGLEPCTTYHYQAEAENSVNEGTPSLGGDKAFTTRCEFGLFLAKDGVGTSTEMWEMKADGSGAHALGPAPEDSQQPSLSPDGSSIAYAALISILFRQNFESPLSPPANRLRSTRIQPGKPQFTGPGGPRIAAN